MNQNPSTEQVRRITSLQVSSERRVRFGTNAYRSKLTRIIMALQMSRNYVARIMLDGHHHESPSEHRIKCCTNALDQLKPVHLPGQFFFKCRFMQSGNVTRDGHGHGHSL
uniref:(northern house mosquito) hypothetical protein n=1 Tax=Culex pipiens TaxID=7175 RepID=A0A8D8HGT9_CULPI